MGTILPQRGIIYFMTSSTIQPVIDECVPLFRKMAVGQYAVSIGGSHGKKLADRFSDIDFRLFCDDELPDSPERTTLRSEFQSIMAKWRVQGVEIDGVWVRRIAAIEADLANWIHGKGKPEERVWTIWGYYLLPDIANQMVVEDPFGVIAGWKDLLAVYPPSLKQAVLEKHLRSLRYWRQDYHYANKVQRGDPIFLAGLSARLAHDMAQVLFALNEVYFTGDGSNLVYIDTFARKPANFSARMTQALYPPITTDRYAQQRQLLIELIDEVIALTEQYPGL